MRSAHQANVREQKYPPKRKSKFVTCAERPSRPRQRTKVPAKKEKASLRRVRSTHLATSREQKHPPKRKSKFVTCAERPPSKRQRAKVPAKKKKQVCDVCGAPAKLMSESKSTRQKEKASLRRVRSAHPAPKPASPVAQAPVGSKSPLRCKSPNRQKNFFPNSRDFRYNI